MNILIQCMIVARMEIEKQKTEYKHSKLYMYMIHKFT